MYILEQFPTTQEKHDKFINAATDTLLLFNDFCIANPIPYCSAMLSGAVEAENDAN